jgi:hypothetical protein
MSINSRGTPSLLSNIHNFTTFWCLRRFSKPTLNLITYEDFEVFGHNHIATIIKITLQTIFQHQSNNQFINKAVEKSTNKDIETFDEDLIDLIWKSALQNIESKKSV